MLSRRTLIASSSLASISAMLPGCTSWRSDSSNTDRSRLAKTRVMVIGAGMSGLAAAKALKDTGYSVFVVEARNRIGGRIWTDQFQGGFIDLGASWIHGEHDNPLAALAAAHGVKTVVTDDNAYPAMFDASGLAISHVDQARLYELLKQVRKTAYGKRSDPSFAGKSVGFACIEALRQLTSSRTISPAEAIGVRHLLTTEVEGAYATDLDTLSLAHWGAGKWFEGGDMLLPTGFGQLTDALAKGLDIRRSTRVEHLFHHPGRIVAQMGDGLLLSAEKAIVTLPLGVLKAGTTKFTPPLPATKSDAIARLGVGTFNKVYFGFKSCFWPPSSTWIQHAGNAPTSWPMFFNLHHYTGAPVLAAFNVGAFAKDLEMKDDAAIVADGMAVLRQIGSKNGWRVTEPTNVAITRWSRDVVSRGSYVHVPVGASVLDLDEVGAPVGDSLYFAGEATSSQHFMTTHAAYLSGLRAAQRLANDDGIT